MARGVSMIIKLGPEAKSEYTGRAGEGRWEKLPQAKDELLQREINTQRFHQPLYPSSAPVFPHDPKPYVRWYMALTRSVIYRRWNSAGTPYFSQDFTYGLFIHSEEFVPEM